MAGEDREGEEAGEPGTAPEAAMVPDLATVLVVEGMDLAEVGVVVEGAAVEVAKEVVAGPVMDLVADLDTGVAMEVTGVAEVVVAAAAVEEEEVTGAARDTGPAPVMALVLVTEVLGAVAVGAVVAEEVVEGEAGPGLATDQVMGQDLAAEAGDTIEESRWGAATILYLALCSQMLRTRFYPLSRVCISVG